MSLTVTLNVFSGRPNPTWVVPDEAAAELRDRVSRIATLSNLKPPSVLGGLGYRGFSVSHDHDAELTLNLHAGVVDRGGPSPTLIADDREIERFLLSTAGGAIADEVRAHVEQSLAIPISDIVGRVPYLPPSHCPVCHAADAPAYNPGMWNTPAVQPHNNCYNYANNRITNTFAQPGRATGHPIKTLSCPGTVPSAHSDGLVGVANFNAPLAHGAGWYVAVVIWPGVDYHWYRQDKVGCWSHKPGQTAARNVDNSGHAISDPKTADRGPYTSFCTYMVTKSTVHIN